MMTPSEGAVAESSEADFLKLLFSSLSAASLRYAVMRNHGTLPHSLNGSDLDILFHPADRDRALSIVYAAIDKAGGATLGRVDTVGFSKIYAFGRNERFGNEWWGARLDLSFGLMFSGCATLIGDHLLDKRTTSNNGVSALTEDISSVIGVLKEVLHNKTIPQRYIDSAKLAVRDNWSQLALDLEPMGEVALALFKEICIEDLPISDLESKCRILSKEVKLASFIRSPLEYISSRFLFEWSKVVRYVKPPGHMLAVLGTDGAGKSTVISAVQPVLCEATHGEFTVQHLRPGFLPPLARLKGGGTSPQGIVTDPQGSKPSGTLGSLLRLLYLSLDYIIGYWVIVRPKIAKSPAIFLFDRYAYDMATDPLRFRLSLPGWLLRSVVRILPKPDLIFCLEGDPVKLALRKRELPVEEVARQVAELKEFAEQEPRAVLIRTDTPVEESSDKFLTELMTYCGRD